MHFIFLIAKVTSLSKDMVQFFLHVVSHAEETYLPLLVLWVCFSTR